MESIIKEMYVAIPKFNYYYGFAPFKIGRVEYVGNTSNTYASGNKYSGQIWEEGDKKFYVKEGVVTSSKVIGQVLEEKEKEIALQEE